MPRQARQRDPFGLYHIRQHAAPDRAIFRDDRDREALVQVLEQTLKRFPADLVAYCMIEPHTYHLIIRFRGCDISQFMSSLNIAFTAATNHAGGLFRDRYKSKLIQASQDLQHLLEQLKQRSESAVQWNSFCTLDQLQGPLSELIIDPDAHPQTRGQTCLTTPEELQNWLDTELQATGQSFTDVLSDLDLRNTWLRRARYHSQLTLKELGQVFGGLSESMVSRIVKEGAPHA